MAGVEGVRHLSQQVGARPVDPVKIDWDLEDLLPVAHVGRSAHAHRAFKPRLGEPTPALGSVSSNIRRRSSAASALVSPMWVRASS